MTSNATVLTSAMRSGDFSQLSKALTDPLSKAPFPGNILPASRFSKPAVNFLNKFVPLPNLGNNYVTPQPAPKDGNQISHPHRSRAEPERQALRAVYLQ